MSISTARIRRECEGGTFCHEMAYEVCRERDELQASYAAQAAEIAELRELANDKSRIIEKQFRHMTDLQNAILQDDAPTSTGWAQQRALERAAELTALRTAASPFEDERPVDEAWLREIGFKGPKFDLDRLRLEKDRLMVTHFNGFNVWWIHGPNASSRMIDGFTRGQLLKLLAAIRPGGVK